MKNTNLKSKILMFERTLHSIAIGSILLLTISVPGSAQPSGLRLIAGDRVTSITRHGITWYFSDNVENGYFANGDPWVVGPVTITDIDPHSVIEDGWTRNGSMINPSRHTTQGYDSRPESGSYSARSNVGRPNGAELSAANPLVVQPGESLVSSRSKSTPDNRQQMLDAAILTVVESSVRKGTFRPPYTETDKALRWHVDDIDWDALEERQVERSRLAPGDLPDPASRAAAHSRLFLDHSEAWWWYRVSPANHGVMYGREVAKRNGDGALTLLLDFSRAELGALAINYIQTGIDIYGLAQTGQQWFNNGGIFHGRKIPVVFAGWLLNDSGMLEYADASKHFVFMEDQQTNHVTQGMINDHGYPQAMLGYPDWAIRFGSYLGLVSYASLPPDPSWSATYRNINISMAGPVLAAHIAGLESEWNWPALFEYIDRAYNARSDGPGDDPMGTHSMWRVSTNGITALTAAMWEEFRGD